MAGSRGRGRPRPIVRLFRVFIVVVAGIAIGVGAYRALGVVRDFAETTRTTPRFDPPVWAGQLVPVPCATGGFYARHEQTIVLTISAHCAVAKPGATLLDSDGRSVGIFGPAAELADCPVGRFCAPSDFVSLALAPDRIPWGHLNLVDLGAGGYRTIEEGTHPLACADLHVGDKVEVDGLEHYRSGRIIASGPYEYSTDTIFPCMLITDISAYLGDSGGAVLVNGLPAGTTAREIGGDLAFTPLAEGLENLGLILCTTPDCDLSPIPVR
ncbi:MAG TPA: hypothetical protein VL749_09320 [Patescibacteria group bacterium]|nr:hypothetical protein [Patescibacteria group bacterium]